MKYVDVGGQAIIEGVMMKRQDVYAIAVRKPDHEIILEKKVYKSFTKRNKIFGLPIIRGAVAFVESLVMGMKILTYSAEFFEVDGEVEPSKFEKKFENKFGKKKMDDMLILLSIILATLLSIGLFILLPLGISQLLKPILESTRMINLVDGLIRVLILFGYIYLISLMKDIQRVFQYHGAEHKSIHCLENEEELTIENVKKQSRLHKRCGTNFLFVVVIISVVVLTLFNVDTFFLRLGIRLIMLPFIAGLSYEVIKLLGKNDNVFSDIVSFPGLCLQKITTSEPDDEQIEVAIAALKGALEG
ncbi:MAG: DUF1385 domain-containing protein [Firmicutes bacterium HGW-Firmicutes-7]|nr:MAG: DUF1385 domain-containing protein [Firmicutes bacterium HGW-Firmicutes-7]